MAYRKAEDQDRDLRENTRSVEDLFKMQWADYLKIKAIRHVYEDYQKGVEIFSLIEGPIAIEWVQRNIEWMQAWINRQEPYEDQLSPSRSQSPGLSHTQEEFQEEPEEAGEYFWPVVERTEEQMPGEAEEYAEDWGARTPTPEYLAEDNPWSTTESPGSWEQQVKAAQDQVKLAEFKAEQVQAMAEIPGVPMDTSAGRVRHRLVQLRAEFFAEQARLKPQRKRVRIRATRSGENGPPVKCHHCRKLGHIRPCCPYRDQPRIQEQSPPLLVARQKVTSTARPFPKGVVLPHVQLDPVAVFKRQLREDPVHHEALDREGLVEPLIKKLEDSRPRELRAPVVFISDEGGRSKSTIVDSGATDCFVSQKWAERVGLKISPLTRGGCCSARGLGRRLHTCLSRPTSGLLRASQLIFGLPLRGNDCFVPASESFSMFL